MFAARYFAERYWPRRYWPAVGAEAPPAPTSSFVTGAGAGGSAVPSVSRRRRSEAFVRQPPLFARLEIFLPAVSLRLRGAATVEAPDPVEAAPVLPPEPLRVVTGRLDIVLAVAELRLRGSARVLSMDARIRQAVEDHLLALG